MKSMLITNWPINNCKIADENFDDIFLLNEYSFGKSTYIKPLLAKKNDVFAEILMGADYFNHLSKAKKIEDLPLYIIPENISKIELLELVTDFFLSENTLNNLIISKLLCLMDKYEIDDENKKLFISKKLRISAKPKIIDKYRKFSSIDFGISQYLINKKAPLKAWEYLTEFSGKEQGVFVELIKIVKPSLSNLLEILENLVEYQKISSESFTNIFKELELVTILHENRDDKLQFIRDEIMNLRYPTLFKHRREIATLFAEISKPNNINLQYDQAFEKKEIRGFFTLSNAESIEDLKRFLSTDNQKKLIDIIKKL